MRRPNSILFMIGMSYVALALISLTMNLSQRLLNAIALGAVMISVSELLGVINMQRVKRRSVVDILKSEKCVDKYGVAMLYIQEILNEKTRVVEKRKSVLAALSIFLDSLAFMCLLVYPHTSILSLYDNSNRFGAFCTVISLGIMIFAIAIGNEGDLDSELKDAREVISCLDFANNESQKLVEKAVELAETATDIGLKKNSAI